MIKTESLAQLFLVLGGTLLLVSLSIPLNNEEVRNDLPCYDKAGKVINEVTCTGKVAPDIVTDLSLYGWAMVLGGVLLLILSLVRVGE